MVPDSTGSDGYLPSFSRFDEDGHFHAEALLDEMVMDGTEHQQCAQRDPAQSIKKKKTKTDGLDVWISQGPADTLWVRRLCRRG